MKKLVGLVLVGVMSVATVMADDTHLGATDLTTCKVKTEGKNLGTTDQVGSTQGTTAQTTQTGTAAGNVGQTNP